MSDIQDLNRISSIEQLQHIKGPAAPQEGQRLGMYMDNVLGADGGRAQGSLNLDAVMSGCLNGYLGLGETALEGLDSPLASTAIMPRDKGFSQAMAMAVPPPPPQAMEMKASETLASLDSAMEVNEVALGLVPGLSTINIAETKTSPVALAGIMESKGTENEALQPELKQAMGNIETLARWEMNVQNEIAMLDTQQTINQTLASVPPPRPAEVGLNTSSTDASANDLAMNLQAGETFNVQPMVGKPVIEGNREQYSSAFSQIHETLSRYDAAGNSGLVGMSDYLGVPSSGNAAVGLNTAPSFMGLREVPSTQLLGHQSIVNNELFGFLDLSSYSQSLAMGISPTSTTAMLSPLSYLSRLLNGYYI